MKTLPDKSVDCFVCDLPYGQLSKTETTKLHRAEPGKEHVPRSRVIACPWDVKIDLETFWKEVKRLCRNDHTPVLMFCNTKFGYELIKSNESWFRYDLVWDKGHGISFLLANKMPMKSHEMIYVFSKKGSFYRRVDVKTNKPDWFIDYTKQKSPISVQYGITRQTKTGTGSGKDGLRCPLSVIPIPGKLQGEHPTQKPKELYRWLLERFVSDGGTVLDPTAGSFNSIAVARELGYRAIGIEKDNDYFWKAVARGMA